MKKNSKFKIFIISLIAILNLSIFTIPTFATNPIAVIAAKTTTICNLDNVPSEVKNASGCTQGGDTIDDIIVNILTAIIGAIGIVAVIFVVVGGVNYMTSAGDPGKVKKAKDTILYALIGLIICALAFVIVNFVIKKIS